MNRDKKNSFWLAMNFIITSVLALVMLKLNIENFGNQKFGIWLILSSIWGFSTSLDFGFGTSIVKFVAEYKKINNDSISTLLTSSLLVFVILGVLLVLIGNLVAIQIYFNNQIIIPKQLRSEFINIFMLLGINFFIRYILIFFNSIFEGLNEFIITSKLLLIQSLLNLIAVVFVYFNNLTITALSFGYLLVSFISLIMFWTVFRVRYKNYKFSFRYFSLQEIKKILRFSFTVQLMSVFNTIIDPIIKYIIGNYYQVNSIPAYEIARRFATAISGLFFNAFKIVLPKASVLVLKDEQKLFLNNQLHKYCKFGVLYSGIFYGIILLPIILVIDQVFNLQEAIIIFLILSLPETVNNFGYSIYNFLLGTGKVSLLATVQLINLLMTIFSVTICFILFDNVFGLIGYFFSVIIGNIIMIIFLNRTWKFNILLFLKKTKAYKLILQILLLFSLTILFLTNGYTNYAFITIFMFIIFSVFMNDIYEYSKMLYAELKS
jgi:O-antigen/teichoic acid export membrane protein